MRDADYIAAFQKVVMPIAYEFRPDFVLGKAFGSSRVLRQKVKLCLLSVTQFPLALMLRKETSWADVTSPQVDTPK